MDPSTPQEVDDLKAGAVEPSHVELPVIVPVTDPWQFSSKSEAWHKDFNRKLLWKVDLRLLPMLCLMHAARLHSKGSF